MPPSSSGDEDMAWREEKKENVVSVCLGLGPRGIQEPLGRADILDDDTDTTAVLCGR